MARTIRPRPGPRPRGLRGLDRLHDRARGGVRDRRSGDARARSTASRTSTAPPGRRPCSPTSAAGELIASEIEIRSGRGETFAEAAEAQRERRERLFALAAEMGLGLAATGTHPWANYLDQRIIDTPHYQRLQHDLGWVAQRNNTWSLHVHVGVRGADRAIAVCDCAARAAAAAARGLGQLALPRPPRHRPAHGPHRDLHPDLPALRDPRAVRHLGRSTRTSSTCCARTDTIVESTQLWWSVRPHHRFGTVEVRICDAQTAARSRSRSRR